MLNCSSSGVPVNYVVVSVYPMHVCYSNYDVSGMVTCQAITEAGEWSDDAYPMIAFSFLHVYQEDL